MKRKSIAVIVFVEVFLSVLVALAMAAQDKYTLKVPNGLSFSEFRGYEAWQAVSISQDGNLIAAILANPVMIKAYLAGVPGNGKPFPDGAKMAKIHWNPKKLETFPAATVPGTVALGKVSLVFGFQWIFAILAPSGNGLPLPGTPAW